MSTSTRVEAGRALHPAVPGEVDPELARLVEIDSVESRTTLYLRMLYSPHYVAQLQQVLARGESRVAPETRAFVSTLDFERLKIEQGARARNLTHQLGMFCESLFPLLAEDEQLRLVKCFTDSPEFWQARGRSLVENFCLVAWRELSQAGRPFLAEVARIEGVLSGLMAAREQASPWPAATGLAHERVTRPGGMVAERFWAGWRLIDGGGQLPRRENAAALEADASPHWTTVGIEEDQSVTVECTRC